MGDGPPSGIVVVGFPPSALAAPGVGGGLQVRKLAISPDVASSPQGLEAQRLAMPPHAGLGPKIPHYSFVVTSKESDRSGVIAVTMADGNLMARISIRASSSSAPIRPRSSSRDSRRTTTVRRRWTRSGAVPTDGTWEQGAAYACQGARCRTEVRNSNVLSPIRPWPPSAP